MRDGLEGRLINERLNAQQKRHATYIIRTFNISYACHYKPWLVYFLPHFSLQFIIKRESRAGYNGACTVLYVTQLKTYITQAQCTLGWNPFWGIFFFLKFEELSCEKAAAQKLEGRLINWKTELYHTLNNGVLFYYICVYNAGPMYFGLKSFLNYIGMRFH